MNHQLHYPTVWNKKVRRWDDGKVSVRPFFSLSPAHFNHLILAKLMAKGYMMILHKVFRCQKGDLLLINLHPVGGHPANLNVKGLVQI